MFGSFRNYLAGGLLTLTLGCSSGNTAPEQKDSLLKDTRDINYRTLSCSGREIVPDDGDTFSCNAEVIRVLGIDTPEIKHPEVGIYEDQPFGREAAAYAQRILSKAAYVKIISSGKDRHGRTLAHVIVDGELYAIKLIQEGLAYETISRYGDNGFPGLALLIQEAWRSNGERCLRFESPNDWRKTHQKKS